MFSNLASTTKFYLFVRRMKHHQQSSVHIVDKPKVGLKLGRNIEMERIKEGEDIYLECSVDSRPDPFKLFFRHQVIVSIF